MQKGNCYLLVDPILICFFLQDSVCLFAAIPRFQRSISTKGWTSGERGRFVDYCRSGHSRAKESPPEAENYWDHSWSAQSPLSRFGSSWRTRRQSSSSHLQAGKKCHAIRHLRHSKVEARLWEPWTMGESIDGLDINVGFLQIFKWFSNSQVF